MTHIHELLKGRENIRQDEKNWVLNEALDAKKLKSGGTFRNVIARKLNDVVVPIFAEILAMIDHNYNLDLVDPKTQDTPVTQFWLAMFRNPQVMHFSYADMSVREQVPGVGGRLAEEEFRCQLPFSWLVREAFEAQWDSAKSVAGDYVLLVCFEDKVIHPFLVTQEMYQYSCTGSCMYLSLRLPLAMF